MDIKEERLKRGMSKREFARLLGVSETSVRRYESGECRPNPEVLARLSDAKVKPWAELNHIEEMLSPTIGDYILIGATLALVATAFVMWLL